MSDPVIILASPHSFTSVVGTMLGPHPQMYGLPEVYLFVAETIQERAHEITRRRYHQHDLLRVVAQLFVGESTNQTIARAQWSGWLKVVMMTENFMLFRQLGLSECWESRLGCQVQRKSYLSA